MAQIKINMDSLKSKRSIVRHKIKDGTSTFRVLPPFGEQSNGWPFRRWVLVWGLQDPETGRARPFVSSIMSEKRCPVQEYVKALQEKAEQYKATGNKDSLKRVNELISTLRPKTIYLYNAADKSGAVGILELKPTAHDQLKELISEYVRDYNQDPTSLNSSDDDSGVWFDFSRSGIGFDTKYSVKKAQTKQKLNGQMVFVDDRSPLPDSIVQGYESMAYDIHSLYQHNTYEKMDQILRANLKAMGVEKEFLCGLDLDDAGSIAATEDAPPQLKKAEPVKRPAPNLNLSSQGEDEDEALAESTMGVEDLFAEADKILNG